MKFGNLRQDFSNNLLKGALVLLPFILTFYFIFWFAEFFDRAFSGIIVSFGIRKELPFGMGIVVGLGLIYVIGKTSEFFIARYVKDLLERIIIRLPILGTVFGSVRDLAKFIKEAEGTPQGKAVIVSFENPNFKIAGFLTRNNLNDLPTSDQLGDLVAVYIPLAYMVGGGFTVFVHKDRVRELNLPFDQAMRASLSAWMLKSEGPSGKTDVSMKPGRS